MTRQGEWPGAARPPDSGHQAAEVAGHLYRLPGAEQADACLQLMSAACDAAGAPAARGRGEGAGG